MTSSEPRIDKQDRIWDYYQNESEVTFVGLGPRMRWLARQLGRGEVVLNVGVGKGELEELALARGVDVHSLDLSERSIEQLRERFGLAEKARAGTLTQLPWPEAHFDAVVLSEVIEHLSPEDSERALAEVRRVLRPGGKLVGTVPSNEVLEDNLVMCPDCGKRFHRWGHQQRFDRESLAALLGRQLQVDRVGTRLFVAWGVLNWKGKLVGALRLVARAFGVHGSGENLVFIAVKAGD